MATIEAMIPRKRRTKGDGYSIPKMPSLDAGDGNFSDSCSDSGCSTGKRKPKRRRTNQNDDPMLAMSVCSLESEGSFSGYSEAEEDNGSNKENGNKRQRTDKGAVPEVPQALRVPTEYLKLKEYDQEDIKEYCWGCDYRFGSSRIAGLHANVDDVYAAFEQNRDLPIDRLAELIEQTHEERIYLPALRAGEHVEPWPAEMIKTHLRIHMVEPSLQLNALVKDANVIVSALKDSLIEMIDCGDGTKKPVPNNRNIKSYREFGVYVTKLLQNQRHFVNNSRTKRN